jgi:hypothetical protein
VYLYNSYCYETIESAAASFYSKGIIDGLGLITSSSITAPDTVSFIYLPLSEVAKPIPIYSAFTYRFLSCNSIGFDNSFFGITSADALLISWWGLQWF